MKLFIDRKKREFVKSMTSNVGLDYLVLKRRDLVPLEIIFVENGAAVGMGAAAEIKCGLKLAFSDANFLAIATGASPTLDLNTVPIESAFATGAASIQSLIEVRWLVPGEGLRTATLRAELQNSVILGTEGTPQSMPDGKATQPEAEAGVNNEKWMTPLRTAQALDILAGDVSAAVATESAARAGSDSLLSQNIAEESAARQAADANLQAAISGKAPTIHTHSAAQITDFAAAVAAAAPSPTWASLTGKPSTFPPSEHGHPTDLELLFAAAESAGFNEFIYNPTGDISAIEVYSDALKTMMIYSRTITYDLSGNITTITTTDQRTPSKYLIKSVTYSGSGDIANVTSSYYGF